MNKLVKMKDAALGSPKTSVGAVAVILAVVATCLQAYDGGGVAAVLELNWLLLGPALVGAYSLLSARDNDKTSEDAGAK